MRHQIDLAWLRQDQHQTWFEPLLQELAPALDKIRLCELPRESWSPISPLVLAKSLIQLRRYDALLITVTIETLAWTRQCLAAVPRGHVMPIVGVCQGLRCGAMLDLMELGMSDIVCLPVGGEEFRARVIHVVSHAPRAIGLRESENKPNLDKPDPRRPNSRRPGIQDKQATQSLKVSELVWPNIGFQENKRRMIDLFEKHYVRAALRQANGNISEAARRSSKDRRAFWELMRRHGIKTSSKSS